MLLNGLRRWLVSERRAAETVVVSALSALSVFVAGIVLARALGPDGRGRVAAHLVGIATSAALGSLGVSYAAAFAAARSGRSLIAFRAVWRLGSVSLGATFALDLLIESVVVRSHSFSEMTWAVLGAVASQTASITLGWMQGSQTMSLWNVLRLIPYGLHFVFLLILWLNQRLTVGNAVMMFVIAQLAAVGPGLFLTISARPSGQERSDRPLESREIWRFSRGIAVSAVLYQLNQRLDQLWLAFLNRSGDLGVYASSVTLAGLGLPFGAGLAQATYAEGLHAASGERGRLTRRRVLMAVVVTSLCALALSWLARPLMLGIYGPAFARGAGALAVLSWGTVFLAGNYVAAESLRSAGKSAATIRADSLAAGTSLILLPVAIWRFGILGAAAVSVLSYFVGFAWNLASAARLHRRDQERVEK